MILKLQTEKPILIFFK